MTLNFCRMGLKGDHTRLADAEVNLVSANGEEERPKKQNKCAKEGNHGHHPGWELSGHDCSKKPHVSRIRCHFKIFNPENAVFGIFSDFAAVAPRERSEPTATQLQQALIKILSKHLASNKKVNFAFQQQSSHLPLMNPSPTEIVELFSFVETTLIQYATVAGHFPVRQPRLLRQSQRRPTKLKYPLKKQRVRLKQMLPGRLRPDQKPRCNLRTPHSLHAKGRNRSPQKQNKGARVPVKESEDVQSLDLRSANSSASTSSEKLSTGR